MQEWYSVFISTYYRQNLPCLGLKTTYFSQIQVFKQFIQHAIIWHATLLLSFNKSIFWQKVSFYVFKNHKMKTFMFWPGLYQTSCLVHDFSYLHFFKGQIINWNKSYTLLLSSEPIIVRSWMSLFNFVTYSYCIYF